MVFLSKVMTTYHFNAMDEKKDKQTQNKIILAHLSNFWSIEYLTALIEYGCYSFAQKIRDIRNDGYCMVNEMISTTSRITVNTVHFANYILR